MRRNVGRMADGRAQSDKPPLGFGSVPGPAPFAELSDAKAYGSTSAVVNARLATTAAALLDRRGDERFPRERASKEVAKHSPGCKRLSDAARASLALLAAVTLVDAPLRPRSIPPVVDSMDSEPTAGLTVAGPGRPPKVCSWMQRRS